MANTTLYRSSLFFGGIHFFFMGFYNVFSHHYSWLVTCGIVTSLLNHGSTNKGFQTLDRFVIRFSVLYAVFVLNCLHTSSTVLFVSAMTLTYLESKRRKNTNFHVVCHFLGTLFNVCVFASTWVFVVYLQLWIDSSANEPGHIDLYILFVFL